MYVLYNCIGHGVAVVYVCRVRVEWFDNNNYIWLSHKWFSLD